MCWRSIESTSHTTLKSYSVNRSLGRTLLISKIKVIQSLPVQHGHLCMCCRRLALSASSKAFLRLSWKHGPREKLKSWRQARSARGEVGTRTERERGAMRRKKDHFRSPLSLIIKWSRVSRFCAFNFRRFHYNFNDNFLRSTSDLREFFS